VKHNQHPLEAAFVGLSHFDGIGASWGYRRARVSGGVSSMVMTELFARIQSSWDLTLAIAHVNHQLRGEESVGTKLLCANVPSCGESHFMVNVSIPTATRRQSSVQTRSCPQLRYEVFERVRGETERHALRPLIKQTNNAETVLLQCAAMEPEFGASREFPVPPIQGRSSGPLLFCPGDRRSLSLAEDQGFTSDSTLPMNPRSTGAGTTSA